MIQFDDKSVEGWYQLIIFPKLKHSNTMEAGHEFQNLYRIDTGNWSWFSDKLKKLGGTASSQAFPVSCCTGPMSPIKFGILTFRCWYRNITFGLSFSWLGCVLVGPVWSCFHLAYLSSWYTRLMSPHLIIWSCEAVCPDGPRICHGLPNIIWMAWEWADSSVDI